MGYFDWIEEEQLANWMEEQHVVEAVLGDPDPSGAGGGGSGGSGIGGGADSADGGGDEVCAENILGGTSEHQLVVVCYDQTC